MDTQSSGHWQTKTVGFPTLTELNPHPKPGLSQLLEAFLIVCLVHFRASHPSLQKTTPQATTGGTEFVILEQLDICFVNQPGWVLWSPSNTYTQSSNTPCALHVNTKLVNRLDGSCGYGSASCMDSDDKCEFNICMTSWTSTPSAVNGTRSGQR